jgi:hypothetical protein
MLQDIIITIGEIVAAVAILVAAIAVGPLLYVAWLSVTRRPFE